MAIPTDITRAQRERGTVRRANRPGLGPISLSASAFLLVLLATVGPSNPASALTLNGIQLDNGTCVQNLQVGADANASLTTTPSFLLTGDGGLSSYSASIDGKSLGTFHSDGYGRVCIDDATTLSEGSHQLTAEELAPRPSNVISPFNFDVDAVPLPAPTAVTLDPDSDTGTQGDNITSYSDPNIDGLSPPSVPIRILENGFMVGGAMASSSGQWTAITNPLPVGVNDLTAVDVNPAGLQSLPSSILAVTVVTTPPVAPSAPTLDPASGSGDTPSVSNPTVDGVGTLAGGSISVYVDDVMIGSTISNGAGDWAYSLPVLSTGTHSVSATVTDVAGNVSPQSPALVLTMGSQFVPSAPVLSALAGNGSVSLNWSIPSNGGSLITSYDVYRGTASGAEGLVGPVTTTSEVDISVTNGVTYYYEVSAVNAVGQGPRSAEVSVVPMAPGEAPIIVSPPNVTAKIHHAFSFTVIADGSPAPTYFESGAIPSGVKFNAATGTLSGTAKAGTKGSHKIVVTATNPLGTAVQTLTFRVT